MYPKIPPTVCYPEGGGYWINIRNILLLSQFVECIGSYSKTGFRESFSKKCGSYKNSALDHFEPFLVVFRLFWTFKIKNIYFWPHHRIPSEILLSFDVSHIGVPKWSFGVIADPFGSKFRNHPNKNLRVKKNVLHLENWISNLQKELPESIKNCVF